MSLIITAREKVAEIQRIVAECYGLPVSVMCSKDRPVHIAHPRQVAMCLCRELTRLPLEEIALYFGRDHGTVIHAIKAVRNRADTEAAYSQEVWMIWKKVIAAIHGAHLKSA